MNTLGEYSLAEYWERVEINRAKLIAKRTLKDSPLGASPSFVQQYNHTFFLPPKPVVDKLLYNRASKIKQALIRAQGHSADLSRWCK